jgi:mRNA-degrading endonuclease toxin of MazEF toxin-antitoxin module
MLGRLRRKRVTPVNNVVRIKTYQTPTPAAILFEVEGKLHRGWRDRSGRFTLEQCNLDAANLARHVGDVSPENAGKVENRCLNCFLA